jgi:hypothetical protein
VLEAAVETLQVEGAMLSRFMLKFSRCLPCEEKREASLLLADRLPVEGVGTFELDGDVQWDEGAVLPRSK